MKMKEKKVDKTTRALVVLFHRICRRPKGVANPTFLAWTLQRGEAAEMIPDFEEGAASQLSSFFTTKLKKNRRRLIKTSA